MKTVYLDPSSKHEWRLRLSQDVNYQEVKRDEVQIIEAYSVNIEWDVENYSTWLILKCYANIDGLMVQKSYNPDTVFSKEYVQISNFPKYSIEYESNFEEAKVYREGELWDDVERFEISYDGEIPFITMWIRGSFDLKAS